MKRMHIHIAVNELSESIGFYSTVFGVAPTIEREGYAKWDLSDPEVNFAISLRGGLCGMNHLGIQVDSDNELQEIAQRFEKAEIKYSKQEGTSCCYSRSNKYWVLDPQGVAWESFHTLSTTEGSNIGPEESPLCCIPLNVSQPSDNKDVCCVPSEGDVEGCCSLNGSVG